MTQDEFELKTLKCIECQKPKKEITIELIEKIVCEHFGVTIDELKKQNKSIRQSYVLPRRFIIYFLLTELKWSQSKASGYFMQGHSTAHDILIKFAWFKKNDKKFNKILTEITLKFYD